MSSYAYKNKKTLMVKKNLFFGSFFISLLIALLFPAVSYGAVFPDDQFGKFEIQNDAREIIEGIKEEYRANELVVRYKGDSEPFRIMRLSSGASISSMRTMLESRKDVLYAEPNYMVHAHMTPNDPYYSYQWNLHAIGTEEAWDTTSGSDVTVAIIDTGAAYENYNVGWQRYYRAPDLANTIFVSGYDFVNGDSHPNDDNGHGTHVTGTVAQSTNNGIGMSGVAYGAQIMPIKVLDRRGAGTYADLANGIYWAVDHGAQVINLSLGGSSPATYLEEAVRYAYENGVVVIASAGNESSSSVNYPAAYNDYVIAVGATRYDDTLAPYSNFGGGVDVVAPGGDLNVDQNEDGYGDGVLQETFQRRTSDFGYYFFQGTSMAAPHVTATAALVIANGNASTPDEVRSALEETAVDLGVSGRDDTYGHGLINAPLALAWTAGPVDNPPVISITDPAESANVSGAVVVIADATDDIGIDRVDFFIDNVLAGSDTTVPYEWVWDTTAVSDGVHTITATAVDTTSQSTDININVLVDNINDSPIADAGPDQYANDADGNGYESITLDGSDSYDPDGAIVSYEWNENGALISTEAVITTDLSVGNHDISLVVTDDQGATGTDTIFVSVAENQAPTADAGADQTTHVGNAINFDGSGSSDADGSITSYEWSFGDGETANTATINHAYAAPGTYTATLTVTDNGGLTAQDTAEITITEASAEPALHVGDIAFNFDKREFRAISYCKVTANVQVMDNLDTSIGDVAVSGMWSGAYSRNVSASTDNAGVASFTTRWIRGCGTFTFTVNGISKDGWLYDESANIETSDSIDL